MNKNYKIDNTIYQNTYIEWAIEAFSDIANIVHVNWDIVITWEDNESIELIFCEFMNFIIWLINE
jgi:hypothetical protein